MRTRLLLASTATVLVMVALVGLYLIDPAAMVQSLAGISSLAGVAFGLLAFVRALQWISTRFDHPATARVPVSREP